MADRRKSQAGRKTSITRKQSVTHGLAYQESIKEKTQRYKDDREGRSSRITQPMKWLIVTASDYFDIEDSAITNFILDSEDQVKIFESFIGKNGYRSVKMYYQEGDTPKIESGRVYPRTENGKCMKITLDVGDNDELIGKCYYFTKDKPETILTVRNVAEATQSGGIDTENFKGSLLLAFRKTIQMAFLPALTENDGWGKLGDNKEGETQVIKFRAKLENNVNYLDSADKHTKNIIFLADGPGDEMLESIIGPVKQKESASKPEKIKILEDLVLNTWCQQLNQVLAESDQMRKEADDTGPIAELDHWRGLSSRFNFILEQIRSERVKSCIHTLQFAKSKVVKEWLEFEGKVTDEANEARDNVKFLSDLETVCMPLYYTDPDLMMECIPNLINVVTNIHNISRYFNTSQKMTSLYVKVTNQMVNSCRKYLTDSGVHRIWEQDPKLVLEKIRKVKELSLCYKNNFMNTKDKVNAECSEMYIFGKLDQFCKRLENIEQLIHTMQDYNILNTSKIEGIDIIGAKFQSIVQTIKKKPYDILDTRNGKKEFEKDYSIFMDSMNGVEDSILNFMDESFDKVKTTENALRLIERFKNLNLNFMKPFIEEKYMLILQIHTKYLDKVKEHYNETKDNPPFPNNVPELAGKGGLSLVSL
jgi:dynein heavy chain